MKRGAYYNEHDPNAAAWLRGLIAAGLIAAGLIAAGDVDERSITEIQPQELYGYTQAHFFAGVGGWSLALRLAGWPDERPVWTGSCPCQPFSVAGKGAGAADERHLWPVWFPLIAECGPVAVFGEQVADAIGKGWLDGVSADLEGEGYACGSVVLGAHSAGADHIRKRLYWVADAASNSGAEYVGEPRGGLRRQAGPHHSADGGSNPRGLADGERTGLQGHGGHGGDGREPGRIDPLAAGSTPAGGAALRVGNAALREQQRIRQSGEIDGRPIPPRGSGAWTGGLGLTAGHGRQTGQPAATGARHGDTFEPASFWAESRFILCRDGKHRRIPVEPALFPLADGLPYKLARRGSIRPALLKGAGNAIVPQVAAEFIAAYMDHQREEAQHGR